MRIRYTRRALKDLDEIQAYLSTRSPRGVVTVRARLESVLANLSRNPDIGRRTSNGRLRRIVATPLPYLIFQQVETEAIVVIAIRHTTRDPSSMPWR